MMSDWWQDELPLNEEHRAWLVRGEAAIDRIRDGAELSADEWVAAYLRAQLQASSEWVLQAAADGALGFWLDDHLPGGNPDLALLVQEFRSQVLLARLDPLSAEFGRLMWNIDQMQAVQPMGFVDVMGGTPRDEIDTWTASVAERMPMVAPDPAIWEIPEGPQIHAPDLGP